MSLSAHLWTVWPLVRVAVRPLKPPASVDWSAAVSDQHRGRVRLTGRLSVSSSDPSSLLILVHGLGGSADSRYLIRAARVAETLGLSSLRLHLRGADGGGEDFYHAGLSADLAAVVASPALREFTTLYLLGYSLGGHVVLKFATEVGDRRLRAAAAVCAPLDLERTVRAFDRPARWPYRRYVLSNLLSQYAEVAACRSVPTPLAEVRRIRTLREWDRRTVVPRFGFRSPEDYYRRASVAARLDQLRLPALLVAAGGDPMVAADAIAPALDRRGNHLEVRWVRGGHVSFPADLDLGLPGSRGLEPQVIRWLLANRSQFVGPIDGNS